MSHPKLTRILSIVLAAGLTPLATANDGNEAHVDFAAGAEGWSINGLDAVSATGGNPAERIHWNDPIDNFGVEIRNSTAPEFLGDYGLKGPVSLSIDVQVDYIAFFGSPVPRELVLILFDDDTYLGAPAAQVWTSLGTLDGNGMDWTTLSATVTDVFSNTLPAGWNGAGAEDPQTFEPILPAGRSWADVLAGVDRIQFTTYVPGFFFGFTNFNFSVDNITIEPAMGPAWTDLGFSLAGTSGSPCFWGESTLAAGDPITLHLGNALPGSTAFLCVGYSALNFSPFYGGTFVPDIAAPGFIVPIPTSGDGTVTIASTWPAGVPSAFELYLQYWIEDAGGPLGKSASNALKGTTP